MLAMTTTPGATPTAPLPAAAPEVGQSLDLTQPKTSAVQGAAQEQAGVVWTGKLNVGPKAYPENWVAYDLVPELTGYDMVVLQEAQDSGKFRLVIEAIQQLVVSHQRDALIAQLLNPDPKDDERISLERQMEILSEGMEQIAARPQIK